MTTETLSKLYLELSQVVPPGTMTRRELELERAISKALFHMDSASPQLRNGPLYQAAGHLRKALGLPPAEIGGKFSEGVPK